MVFPKLASWSQGWGQEARSTPVSCCFSEGAMRKRLASANNPGFVLLWVSKVNIYSIPLLLYPQPYNIN